MIDEDAPAASGPGFVPAIIADRLDDALLALPNAITSTRRKPGRRPAPR
jgi:hypothetical protein